MEAISKLPWYHRAMRSLIRLYVSEGFSDFVAYKKAREKIKEYLRRQGRVPCEK